MLKRDNRTGLILSEIFKMFPNACCELNYTNIFELSVATILSAQTTDKSVNKVTPTLFNKYPNPFSLAHASELEVAEIIKPLGLAKNKSRNIVAFAKKLVDEYDGIVPNDFEKLQTFPGVGRKTANVILTEGYKIPRLPVDTHVERVSKRLGIAKANDSVETVERKITKLFAKKDYGLLHHQFIFFGRYFCKAIKPNCENCIFLNRCKIKKK